jgi:hypothetical protein
VDKFNYIANQVLPKRQTIQMVKEEPSILLEKIRIIVNENSGGLKFIELLSILMTKYHDLFGEQERSGFPEVVEAVIRNSSDLKILDYTQQSMQRAKMFVYTE